MIIPVVLERVVISTDSVVILGIIYQDDTLSGELTSVDVATKKNLDDLVRTGEALLKKPVTRVNLDTGRFEAKDQETNEEALRRFARVLSQERQLRLLRSPHGHSAFPSNKS